MRKIDESKFTDAEELLSAKYGKVGTESRARFDADAEAYKFGVLLRQRRQEMKMTQKQLAQRAGTQRSYVSRIERGQTDIQMSSFLRFLNALGLSMDLHATC